ncbi:hypothetical protein SDC9_88563 [bioreactor metagenome]|uniref:Uncharacterized protein n=1 Tax=bioreactor metagenome TaxID=1076179 RepID=A0A644ZTD4_9ZZZZ
MKRKRFIKLLMAEGIQRNEANEIAKKNDIPYSDRFEIWQIKSRINIRCYADDMIDAMTYALATIQVLTAKMSRFKSSAKE